MASLKQQADKEHAEFEKEWRELGRLIENDKRASAGGDGVVIVSRSIWCKKMR